jgi:diguanylate cyclase (GGDEF)-like protein
MSKKRLSGLKTRHVRKANGQDIPELQYLFVKKDRAIKIIKEMSEFLRILDLRESEILKTMIVRFAIESVEASQGSLIVFDEEKKILRYQNTYVYDSNNKIVLDTNIIEGCSNLVDIHIKAGEGVAGVSYEKGTPILVQSIDDSPYNKPIINEILKIDVGSVIAMPLKINNDISAVFEITKSKSKPPFTNDDLETITIIANFTSTILENAKLFLWAIHDSLTGLFNNHYFFKELGDEIERSKRYGRVFSFAIFDVDNFKKINDTFGHSYGDKALQELASCIEKTIRKDIDIACRYGGDEFILLLPNTSVESAYKVCERLLNQIRPICFKTDDNKEFGFTLSMGICEFPRDGEESYFLFNHADEALYYSKRNGKNRITIYSPQITERTA